MTTPAEPGFYIVQDPMPRQSLERLLLPEAQARPWRNFAASTPTSANGPSPGRWR